MGWEHVNKYDDSNYIFGSGTGYLLVDLNKIRSVKPQIAIHKILVKDNIQNFSQVSNKNYMELDFEKNSIQFHFTANNYQKYEKVYYQYLLEGYENNWSNWSDVPEVFHFQIYRVGIISLLLDLKLEMKFRITQMDLNLKLNHHGIVHLLCL